MIYVKVNDTLYPASISGKVIDRDWDNRESKAITLEGDYATVDALFSNGTMWSIVTEGPVIDEEGNETADIQQTEFDNSAYCIRGDVIAHINGTCTVLMGKPTEVERLQAQIAAMPDYAALAEVIREGVNGIDE